MPQRTTEYQQIIMLIEQQRSTNATIRESDMLVDRLTGKRREVDITIVSKIGDHEVIISVEVNEKTRIADVQWVEQQYQKHQTLPTNKLVLVSKAGFTKGASDKARLLGIDSITVEGVTDFHFGLDKDVFTSARMNFTIPMVNLVVGDERIFLTNMILKCRKDGKEFDISSMATRLLATVIDFKKFHELAGPNHKRNFIMDIPVGDSPITFRHRGKDYELTDKIHFEGYVKKFSIPIVCKIGKYRTDHVIIATSPAGTDERLLVILPRGNVKGKALFMGIELELDLDKPFHDAL